MTPAAISTVGVARPPHVLFAWFLAITISGYSLVGLALATFGLESRTLSIPFRIFVVLLSGVILLEAIRGRWRMRVDVLSVLFWWIYTIRLLFDMGTGAFPEIGETAAFFFATVVIPAFALMASADGFDEVRTARALFLVGMVVAVGTGILNLTGRVDPELMRSQEGRLTFEGLNAITLGHVGVTTFVASLALWRKPGLPGGRPVVAAGGLISLISLALSGSRGPFVSLVVVLMAYAVIRGRWGQIAAAALALLFVIPSIIASHGLTLVDRFANVYTDVSALGRLDFQANAIDQGLANPILGSAYVELSSGEYPHNLTVEAFMALGIVGATLFIIISARSAIIAARRLRAGELLLPLLFIQYLIGTQLSGALWGSAAYWVLAVLLVCTSRMQNPRPGISA